MARVKLGALISHISGSVGGTTFQPNSYGFTMKNKSYQVNSVTDRRTNSNINILRANQIWRQMQPFQRELFDKYSQFHPQYAAGNKSSLLSGYNLFMKYALIFLATDNTPFVTPQFVVPTINVTTPTVSVSGSQMWFNMGVNGGAGEFWILPKFTRPRLKPTYFAPSELRVCKVAYSDIAQPNNYVEIDYIKVFQNLPSVSDYLLCEFTVVAAAAPVIYPVWRGIVRVT